MGVAVGLACLAALALVLLTRSGGRAASREPKGGMPPTATSTTGQAQQAAAALQKLATDPSSLVAAQAKRQVAGRAARAVPRGAKVTPRPSTWEPDGVGGGVMTVTVTPPGGAPVDYAAVMVNENGAWKVLATLVLPSATTAPKPVAS
ncbi:hypothetical protein LK08_30425 [Streptomyces sp. MUSC 125]|uniref:hypothetical protein n=1 Tax=Streptomyces TaxID=1883 RepID=UPI0005751F1D|nr:MULTISPECIES: hypothetical protein [Streptomyces]KIE23326.1 hypothetical protein LK08_30425 [Streptomyces sp. MUSC 125]MCH0558247.1 hypothetical protein [Streptomyces sp. MUM 16J]